MKELWAITEYDNVELVIVQPRDEKERIFWVPSLGQTLTMGYQLFRNEDTAKSVLRQSLRERISALQTKLEAL